MKLSKPMFNMLLGHLNKHMERAIELAMYVFRYEVKKMVQKAYADTPKRVLVYIHEDGTEEILFIIELKEHPLDPNTITTYGGGPLWELMDYIPM